MQSFPSLILFTCLAFIASWYAYLRGYYRTPFSAFEGPYLRFRDLLLICLAFFFCAILFAQLFTKTLYLTTNGSLSLISIGLLTQLFTYITFMLFVLFYPLLINRLDLQRIWKDSLYPGAKSLSSDIGFGLMSFIVAIFVTLAATSFAELICNLLFGEIATDQIAVRVLKAAMKSPFSFFLSFLMIVIGAPFFEEYLFRGVLQNFLRSRMGARNAILLTGALFSLFHFAPSQKFLNIPLLVSLFVFGSYLGFAYEKTRSLFSPITLHVTFNLISVMKIIYMN